MSFRSLCVFNDAALSIARGVQLAGCENKYTFSPNSSVKELGKFFAPETRVIHSSQVEEYRSKLPTDAQCTFVVLDSFDPKQTDMDTCTELVKWSHELKVPYMVFFLPRKVLSQEKGQAMKRFMEMLHLYDYAVNFQVYDAADFGVALHHHTLIVFAKHIVDQNVASMADGTFPCMPVPNIRKTVGEAFADVNVEPVPDCNYRPLPEVMRPVFEKIPQGKCLLDLPKGVRQRATPYTPSGAHARQYLRRLSNDEPAPVLYHELWAPTKFVGHPTENRGILVEELQALKGLPPDTLDHGRYNMLITRHILLDCIPPALAQAAAEHVKKLLLGEEVTFVPSSQEHVRGSLPLLSMEGWKKKIRKQWECPRRNLKRKRVL